MSEEKVNQTADTSHGSGCSCNRCGSNTRQSELRTGSMSQPKQKVNTCGGCGSIDRKDN